MLFLPTGSPRVIRLHSGFITEPEINRITTYLKKMAEPVLEKWGEKIGPDYLATVRQKLGS